MRKNLFAILFLTLMAVMGGSSIVHRVKVHLETEKTVVKEVTDVPVIRSFAEQYPFAGESKTAEPVPAIFRYFSMANHIFTRTAVYTCTHHPLSHIFTDAILPIDQQCQGDIILNGKSPFVRLQNGYFTFLYPYSQPVELWENLRDFVKWLDARNIKYLSLIAADKGNDTYSVFPDGVPHGYTRMAMEYKAFLEENGIDYLESSDRLIAHNSNFFYWFYKADHHWNVHAGLLVAEETAKRLNEIGIETDTNVIKRENFALTVYPNSFLGSMGRKLGPSYNEDMEVYYPKDTSSFHLQIPNLGIDRTGCFDSTLIDSKSLSAEKSSYVAFLYGGKPLVRVENILSKNATRVLVIKLSKANVFCPYFAFAVRYLDVIAPRHFDGSIRSFIEQTKPDIVITCVDVPYEDNEEFWILK